KYNFCIDYEVTTTTNNLSAIKTHGADVGYKNVTVYESGNGRKELTYTSSSVEGFNEELSSQNLGHPFIPTKNIDYKRGLLLKEGVYNEDNKILYETISDYEYEDHIEVTG